MEYSEELFAESDQESAEPNYCRWSREIAGFARNRCRAWKDQLAKQYREEDLMQEAYIVYMIAVAEYGPEGQDLVESERHFMGIFKQCLYNRFWRFDRDSTSAARRGCGGHWLGEHDKDVVDPRQNEVCLDDTPAVIQKLNARMHVDGDPWYRGRRFIKSVKKRNETYSEYLRRLVGGDEHDLKVALTWLGLEDSEPCTC